MKPKITLSDSEKKQLISDGTLTIKRAAYMNQPKTSIIHGKGIGRLFDKIDYRWVFGDTLAYVKAMTNVGRRGEDYPNNAGNAWNGSKWWEYLGQEMDEFGKIGSKFVFGRKNPLTFKVTDIFVSELAMIDHGKYLKPIFSISISIVNYEED